MMRRVIVRGRVQGVGYRYSCAREAARCDVGGWVRNTGDGGVEALLTGAPDDVESVIEWMRTGPPYAHVTDVEVTQVAGERAVSTLPDSDATGHRFEIRG